MDKKDLYMSLIELLKTYSPDEIQTGLKNCMTKTITIKQINKEKENKNASSKKKIIN